MIDVVDVARSQLGVRERSGANDGLPFERYALPGEGAFAWCARFVRWCFSQIGHGLPGNPYEIGAVVALQAAFVAAGAWLDRDVTPVRGDVIFLLERGKSDAAAAGHHVGIVERVDDDGRVHSIEGNWGEGVATVVRVSDDPTIWGYGRWPLPPAA